MRLPLGLQTQLDVSLEWDFSNAIPNRFEGFHQELNLNRREPGILTLLGLIQLL